MAGKGRQEVFTLVLVLLEETSLRLPTAVILLQLVAPKGPVLPILHLYSGLVLALRVIGRRGGKLQVEIQTDAVRIKPGERREKAPTGRPASPLGMEEAFAF